MPGDLILVNGHVMTGRLGESRPSTGIAVWHGRVAAVGSDAEVLSWRRPGIEVVDLRGRTVTPGFNDAHCHPISVGLGLQEVDARTPPNESIADVVQRIAERARQQPPGTWIVARGYDQARLRESRHPTRHDLDQAAPEHNVVLIRACAHIGVANSRALALAGITATTPDPPGGTIDRDEHGEPTGVVRETALQMVRQRVPEPSEDQIAEALVLAGRQFLSDGVTSVAEAGIRKPEELGAYQRLARERRLPVRTTLMMMIGETLEPLLELGVQTGLGDEWLRIGPAKLFLDGSIGGRTARMSQPYLGEPETCGLWMEEPEVMKQKLLAAHRAGFQCCAHAIGDAAIELLLDIYEEALRQHPRTDHRHRIEHCSILRPDLIERIQRLGVVPIPGTTFLHDFQEAYLTGLGRERLRYAYAMRTFFDRGIIAAASTDAPVCATSAMLGIQTMVTRRNAAGQALWPEECVSLEEAVRAYTYNGAYATFEERVKGTIEPGKLADLTVLETDLRAVEPEALGSVRVDFTVVEGEIVYQRPGAR